MCIETQRHFSSFNEFFAFYVAQHRDPRNRWLHVIGTLVGLVLLVAAFVLHRLWYALLWLPVTYSFAWLGHFMLEKNRPASWGHPWWSFLSDIRMFFLVLTCRFRPWLERDRDSAGGK